MTTDAPGAPASTPSLSMRGIQFRRTDPKDRDERPFELRIRELQLDPRETVACVGPSGSGKTTLVHLAAGILEPGAGEIRVGGQALHLESDATRRAIRAQRIGLVFQEFELLDYLSALDNILLPFRLGGSKDRLAEGRGRAGELADALGIGQLLRRTPERLSQGERQRVAIARALVTAPALVLCDEPTGNLDPDTAGSVLDLLLGQAKEHGAALLMVTHDHTLLNRFDRTIDVRHLDPAALDPKDPSQEELP